MHRNAEGAVCKVSLAAIPLWRYVIQLILHDPVACAFCTHTILHLYRHSLIVIRLVHPVSFQYKRDSIVLGRHSKNKVEKRSHLTPCVGLSTRACRWAYSPVGHLALCSTH